MSVSACLLVGPVMGSRHSRPWTVSDEMFIERGLNAPLKEIARRAGVSHGTLYNLFGSREALIDEVVADLAAERIGEVIEQVGELQADAPAISDAVSGSYHCMDAAGRIIERAQQAGALRPDFTREDLSLLLGTNAMLARAAKDTAPTPGAAVSPSRSTACAPRPPARFPPPPRRTPNRST
ncbi:TetR/AcrR family transcriptional regulator [Streptomyces sp. NPDC001661]